MKNGSHWRCPPDRLHHIGRSTTVAGDRPRGTLFAGSYISLPKSECQCDLDGTTQALAKQTAAAGDRPCVALYSQEATFRSRNQSANALSSASRASWIRFGNGLAAGEHRGGASELPGRLGMINTRCARANSSCRGEAGDRPVVRPMARDYTGRTSGRSSDGASVTVQTRNHWDSVTESYRCRRWREESAWARGGVISRYGSAKRAERQGIDKVAFADL
jgi:hypothetical protein